METVRTHDPVDTDPGMTAQEIGEWTAPAGQAIAPDRSAGSITVAENGDIFARGSFRANPLGMASAFPAAEPVRPGKVVESDPMNPGSIRPARSNGEGTVIGIVVTEAGILLGSGLGRIADRGARHACRTTGAGHHHRQGSRTAGLRCRVDPCAGVGPK